MPFVLYPDLPKAGILRETNKTETETEFLEPLRSRATEVGVVLNRPKWRPRTQLCHEATAYAKEHERDALFHHAAVEAYWVGGETPCDMAVLQKVAQECGLDWSELSQRLESGYYSELIMRQSQEARDIGVFGTPTYGIGGELMFGDLSYETLKAALEKAEIIQ